MIQLSDHFGASATETQIISGTSVRGYLSRMNMSEDSLRAGLVAGDVEAGNVTGFAPNTAAGVRRWLTTVEVCRSELHRLHNWSQNDTQNRPTAVSPSGTLTLSFVGGNSATGMNSPGAVPLAVRRKGPATGEAVYDNGGTLFPMSNLRVIGQGTFSDSMETLQGNWVLLYHRDEEGLRWEISLPSGFQDGQFTGWTTRILMEPINRSSSTLEVPDIGGGDVEFRIA